MQIAELGEERAALEALLQVVQAPACDTGAPSLPELDRMVCTNGGCRLLYCVEIAVAADLHLQVWSAMHQL